MPSDHRFSNRPHRDASWDAASVGVCKIGRDLGSPLPDTIERNLGRFDSCLGKLDDGARAIEHAPGRNRGRTDHVTLKMACSLA